MLQARTRNAPLQSVSTPGSGTRALRGPGQVSPAMDATAGSDFAEIPLRAFRRTPLHLRNQRDAESDDGPVRRLTISAVGNVNFEYSPESLDRSTKIVFIQVMRESLDGRAVRPSAIAAGDAYLDALTTGELYHVDCFPGERDPYMNGDDRGSGPDRGIQGSANPPRSALASDEPFLDPLPPGTTSLLWEFRTAAFSAAGPDAGSYYAYGDWTYAKARGAGGRTDVVGTRAGDPGSPFRSAVALFCSNRGFRLPTPGGAQNGGEGNPAAAGALIGASLGLVAGASIGALLGGPFGAVIGGLLGAGIGALSGAGIGVLAGGPGRTP